jgi:hypothetical protein
MATAKRKPERSKVIPAGGGQATVYPGKGRISFTGKLDPAGWSALARTTKRKEWSKSDVMNALLVEFADQL